MPSIMNYFAAANTSKGFRSLFDHIFSSDTLDRLYIIKGGSGTGKSRMIGDIAEDALTNGYDIEKFYCSSDISSLDGLLIPKLKTAIIDGTSPHATEAKYPGAVEIIIDLVQFMDIDYLTSKKEEIKSKINAKSAMYKTAYKYLSATSDINSAIDELLVKSYMQEKAAASMERLLSEILPKNAAEDNCGVEYRYISSLSAKGKVMNDTLYSSASKVISVSNNYNHGYRYMTELSSLIEGKTQLVVCPTPLNSEKIEALYLPHSSIAIITGNEELLDAKIIKHINIERFIDKPLIKANKHKLRFAERCQDVMLSGAFDAFSDAYTVHQSLEEIYIKSMDFAGKEELTKRISERIFNG